MITVTGGVTMLGFLYDGDGNRLARIVNGTLTTHTLDVGLGLPEVIVEHDNGQVTRYLHLPTGVATDDGAWTYSAADGLGSVRQRLDSNGQVAAVNDRRPFGAPLDSGGGDPYGFTGEWWEDDAGLLFLRARYYDPATGRFLSQDPLPGYAAAPGTLHPYLYGHNNPVMFIDPSGNFGLLGAAIGVLGGGLVGGLIGGVSYALTTDDFSLGGLLGSAGKGALTGAAAGAVVGAFGPVAAPTLLGAVSQSAAIGATSSAVGAGVGYALDTLPNGQFGLGGLFTSMGLGGLSGLVGGGIGGAFGWSTNALLGKLMPHLGLAALPNWAGWTVAVGGGTLGGGIGGVATQAALNVLSCRDDSLWDAFQWGAFSGGVGAGFGYWWQTRAGSGWGGGGWDDEIDGAMSRALAPYDPEFARQQTRRFLQKLGYSSDAINKTMAVPDETFWRLGDMPSEYAKAWQTAVEQVNSGDVYLVGGYAKGYHPHGGQDFDVFIMDIEA